MGRRQGIKLSPAAIQKAQIQYSSKFKTQEALSALCKLSVSTVRRFFNGKVVSNETLQILCDALALDPGELIQPMPGAEVTDKNSSAFVQGLYEEESCNFSNRGNDIPPPPPYLWERTDDMGYAHNANDTAFNS